MAKQLVKFEIGSIYSMRSACDADCIWRFQVTRRTAKSVWLKPWQQGAGAGEITRRKISLNGGCEIAEPFGRYSMSPILKADNLYGQLEYLTPVVDVDDDDAADRAAAACEADAKQSDLEREFDEIEADDDLIVALLDVMTIDRCCGYIADENNSKQNRMIASRVLVELVKRNNVA